MGLMKGQVAIKMCSVHLFCTYMGFCCDLLCCRKNYILVLNAEKVLLKKERAHSSSIYTYLNTLCL